MTTDKKPPDSLLNRRQVLVKGMAGVTGVIGLVGFGMSRTALAQIIPETPGLVEGPYFVEEGINRIDIRSDPTTGVVQPGLTMALAINVSQLHANGTFSPLMGAQVDIWHASAYGLYSDEAAENTSGQKFLRGYQITDAHGSVRFLTIYPGWYSGRTPHIHIRVRVYDSTTAALTYDFETQLFMGEAVTNDVYANVAPYNTRPNRDTTNNTDSIFLGASNDGTPAANAGTETILRLFENRARATASFNIAIDLSNFANEATAGGGPGGGGPGGGGPPPTGGPGGPRGPPPGG